MKESTLQLLRWQQIQDGGGVFDLASSLMPVHCRPGSVVYFSVDGRIECSVIAVDIAKTAKKWLRICVNRETDQWRWKMIEPAASFTWIGLRDADTFERIDLQSFHRRRIWMYVQLDPSPRQRRIDAQLVRQYLQERKNEWPSQPKGS